ncbi:MAG: hypothetical protein ACTSPQ_04880 [Candidatus Helarchaeota archaeon]
MDNEHTNDHTDDVFKDDLQNFLEDVRNIILDGIKENNRLNEIKKLYDLAAKVSEELGDFRSKELYERQLQLFNENKFEYIIENINLTIKSIVQTIHYDIFDHIKRTLNVVETLVETAKEFKITEKTYKRSYAQLNFLLIQYIRKMRALTQELSKIIPKNLIQASLNEWDEKQKVLKMHIEKMKRKSELKLQKYKI